MYLILYQNTILIVHFYMIHNNSIESQILEQKEAQKRIDSFFWGFISGVLAIGIPLVVILYNYSSLLIK